MKVVPGPGEDFSVLVLRSPAGEGRGTFVPPYPLGVPIPWGESPDGALSPADAQEVGSRLFRSLFPEPVRGLFERSLGLVDDGSAETRGLRLALHFSPEDPELALLASLPWELLYSADRGQYLCLGRVSPVVRSFDVPRPARLLQMERPLRILVAAAGNPAGSSPLALGEERKQIRQAWLRCPGVEVDFLDPAAPAALRAKLDEKPFHVLHFMGHGGFDPETGVGSLLFEEAGGRGRLVSGALLADLVGDSPSLRLVHLGGCETARSAHRQGLDPFAGVAAALVRAGLPAVLAMQLPISNRLATAFSSALYGRLSAGDALDAAVVEGRMAMRLARPDSMDWAIPVLFLRGPGGSFSASSGRVETAPAKREAAVGPRPRSRRRREGLRPRFDVFLCYNSVDRARILEICDQLSARGILPWVDERESRPGLPWQQVLEEQLERIRSAAVFVGREGVGPWQRLEIDSLLREFVRRGCVVIPVLLENAPQEPKLPTFLREFTWVDFRAAQPDPLESLVWGITGSVGTKGTAK